MPYVKINTAAPLRGGSGPAEIDTLTIADTLIQLASHQSVIAAEISQIEADIAWLEAANTRYADVRVAGSSSNGNPSSPPAAAGGRQGGGGGASRQQQSGPNGGGVIFGPNGAPIVNAPPNSVAAACFRSQLKDLRLLRDERKAALKEIRQHLALYQLHAPSGVKLLAKVRRTLGTNAGQ